MSPKHSLTFLVLAFACMVLTVAMWDLISWLAAASLYPAFSFLLLAVAYGGAGPKLLLKQDSGRRALLAWFLFSPYFLLNGLLFTIYRLASREPAYAQVAPNIYFGRRLSSSECGAVKWISVLDLAGEFAESRRFRNLAGYRSLPVLDATAPTEEQLRSAVAWIATAATFGPVYVHCALGHGRSACVVIAYLLSSDIVDSVEKGVRRLRTTRPGIRLHQAQRQCLREFEQQMLKKRQG